MNRTVVLIIVVIFTSCQSDRKTLNRSYDYTILQESFDTCYINHFPKEVSSVVQRFYLESVSAAKNSNRSGATLLIKFNDDEIIRLKAEISDSVLTEYKPSDRCMLIVNMLSNDVAGSVFIEHYKVQCSDNYIPIPDFYSLVGHSKSNLYSDECRLTDNFTLYILRSEPGNFLGDYNSTRGIGLPEKWRNGYSRGVAISEEDNYVIFWLEMW